MNERRSEQRRDLWLPALVAMVGVLGSLAVWGVLITDRRQQILAAAEETATETRGAIALALEHQIEALQGLRDLWRTYGVPPTAAWEADVAQRIDRVPGLVSVEWLPGAEAADEDPVARDARDRSAAGRPSDPPLHVGAVRLEGPERDESGAVAYRVRLPLPTTAHPDGTLEARFLADAFLAAVLDGRARGYAVSVSWDGEEIFSRGDASPDPWQRWWQVEKTVALPVGGTWTIRYRPTAEFAALRLTPIPHYLLGAGLLLSLVLAALAHQLRVIVRQSRFLTASNRALEQRGDELESRVADRTAALEEAVRELEAFNYSVSHDLRSPLGAILNFTAILEEDFRDRPLGADGVAILARIRRSASRATTLLEDLLKLSRAGVAALSYELVDMTSLARETFVQVRAAEDGADVEFLLDPLPTALGDRTLLGDVFANLLGNALKYSRGREKRRIAVTGRVEGDECLYEVIDNGQGFDMRFADKLFGLFERLHSNEEVPGTGIGLAMVARIVRRHGGRVWAEGRPGDGARFGFALPVREPT